MIVEENTKAPLRIEKMVVHMSEWEKFYQKVGRCQGKLIKKEPEINEEPSKDEIIEYARLWHKCYYEHLAYIGDRTFRKLIDEIADSMKELTEKTAERQFKYQSKFHDPRKILEHDTFAEEFSKAILEEVDLARFSENHRLTDRMFYLSFYNNLVYEIILKLLIPLLDLMNLANEILDLNIDWITSLVSVALQESLIRKKLREIGQPPKKNDKFHHLSQKLIDHFESTGEKVALDVLLADGFRNVRHPIVHDPVSWNPSDDEANEIIRHTIKLASVLFPKKT